MSAKFYYRIINNELKIENPDAFKLYVASLKSRQGIIKVEPMRNVRSRGNGDLSNVTGLPSNQNGYYWAVVIPILGDYFGYMPDEMHHAIKSKFLRIGGTDEVPKVRSSSTLSRTEWETWMQNIRTWADSDFGVYIPEPHENDQTAD